MHSQFVEKMAEAEALINFRNSAGKSRARSPASDGLPYNYLLPSSGPDITGRGVPYSISI